MLANIVYIGENIAQSTNNITLKPNLKSRVTMTAVSSIERHIIIMSIQHTAIQLSKKNLIILTKLSKKDFIVFILVFLRPLYKDGLTSSLKKHTFYNLLINNILYFCVT